MLGIIFVKNKSEFSFWILGSGGELRSDTFICLKVLGRFVHPLLLSI